MEQLIERSRLNSETLICNINRFIRMVSEGKNLAPRTGFELATCGLTVHHSSTYGDVLFRITPSKNPLKFLQTKYCQVTIEEEKLVQNRYLCRVLVIVIYGINR